MGGGDGWRRLVGVGGMLLVLAGGALAEERSAVTAMADQLRREALAKAKEVEALTPVGGEKETGKKGKSGQPARAPEAPRELGAAPGEELLFNVHWLGVPAAKAAMRAEEPEPGRFAFSAALESVGMVSAFYPVEDLLVVSGHWRAAGLRALYYLKQQREGERLRKLEFRFQRPEKTVLRTRDDRVQPPLTEAEEAINDPIAAFYDLRAHPGLKPGAKLVFTVADGDKKYDAEVSVGPSERMFTPLGWFQALAVQPQLQESMLFRHKGQLTIWLSDDPRRLPLRVETEVKVGHVAADLVGFRDGRGGSGSIHQE